VIVREEWKLSSRRKKEKVGQPKILTRTPTPCRGKKHKIDGELCGKKTARDPPTVKDVISTGIGITKGVWRAARRTWYAVHLEEKRR